MAAGTLCKLTGGVYGTGALPVLACVTLFGLNGNVGASACCRAVTSASCDRLVGLGTDGSTNGGTNGRTRSGITTGGGRCRFPVEGKTQWA